MTHFIILIVCSAFLVWFLTSTVTAFIYTTVRRRLWKLSATDHICWLVLLVSLTALLSLSGVFFGLVDSFKPMIAPYTDHCLEHVCHHLHLCINHLQQDWNVLGIFVVLFFLLVFNQKLLAFLYRTWKYLRSRSAILWLSQREDRFQLLKTSKPMIFTMGFLNPRVFCSEGLIENVSDIELNILLTHESCHVKHKDSLVKWLVKTLSACFYNQRLLNEDLNLRMEQRADQSACKDEESSEVLASLFTRFENWGSLPCDHDYYCAFDENQSRKRNKLMRLFTKGSINTNTLVSIGSLLSVGVITLQFHTSSQMHHLLESFWSFLIS